MLETNSKKKGNNLIFCDYNMKFYWVVGFGDSLRGRRESEQKYNFLQTFPPNPLFWFLFLPSIL
jgi:hypothetical protein